MADELPTLNEYGLLSPGVHVYSLQVIERLFAPLGSPQRRKLFGRLKEYLRELWALEPKAEVILDGSFVMPSVDGELGPSDIDLIVIMPTGWSDEAEFGPAEYNLFSKRRVWKKYHFDVFPVPAGSLMEQGWIKFFMQVNTKWCVPLGLPVGLEKGLVKVLR